MVQVTSQKFFGSGSQVVSELALHGWAQVLYLQKDRAAIGLEAGFGDFERICPLAVGLCDGPLLGTILTAVTVVPLSKAKPGRVVGKGGIKQLAELHQYAILVGCQFER